MEGQGDVIEIVIRDSTNRKISSWRFNTADSELGSGILSFIRRKYNLFSKSKFDKPKDGFKDDKVNW